MTNSRNKGSKKVMEKEPEIWKPTNMIPGVEISNHGRVHNTFTDKILATYITRRGSVCITRPVNSKRHTFKISRLVYQSFNGPLKDGLVIDHIDHNPGNNYYENLQQITVRENGTKDKWRNKNKQSKYVGVKRTWNEKNPWRAYLSVNGEPIHLGVFPTEEEAYKAYQYELNLIGHDQ